MYKYEDEKEELFTDRGQRMFLSIRDRVRDLLDKSGAVRMEEAIKGESGSSWTMLACVDRMVELGEVREVSPPGCAGQHRIFVRNR